MPRKPRIDHPGLLQHVISRGIERKEIFLSEEDYSFFLKILDEILKESKDTGLFAWCLMPNHFHLLLLIGDMPLTTIMRRLLTRYAGYFNAKHKRRGHLFQNRYKSIVCDKDSYFLELIRYIHLNPVRAKIVKNIDELDHYDYTGHGVLMGNNQLSSQSAEDVLRYFGKNKQSSQMAYKQFILDGVNSSKQPDITVPPRKRSPSQDTSPSVPDERFLGEESFMEKVLSRQENRHLSPSKKSIEFIAKEASKRLQGNYDDLFKKSKARTTTKARALTCYLAIQKEGYQARELSKTFAVHPSNITRACKRGEAIYNESQ